VPELGARTDVHHDRHPDLALAIGGITAVFSALHKHFEHSSLSRGPCSGEF